VRYFAVTEEHGPAWDDSLPMRQQAGWDQHAEFMEGLVEEGFVVLGGPLGEGHSVLLVVDAETEDAVRAGLAADPWMRMGLLRIAEVTPWEILLGGSAD
jgi:uncharacterized protein YciI